MDERDLAVLALKIERIANALRGPGFGGWSSRTEEASQLQALADELKQRVI